MDYSGFINEFNGIVCILSLRKNSEGTNNEITITAANRKYLASVNKADEEFVPNRPYTYYISHDPNFESLVVSTVSSKKIRHQYVNAELYNAWIDIYMIPMEDDSEGNGYCLFSYEMTQKAESDKLLDISAQTASMVLKTCIELRETDDFKTAIKSIVRDIRNQCEAKGCSILLTGFEEQSIELLGVDFESELAPIDDDVFFKPEFLKIVETWPDLIEGSNCYIINNDNDLEAVKEKSPLWYESLKYSGVKHLVLFPLRLNEKTIGYIFVINFNPDKIIFIREIMELNSFILSAEVSNFLMREKLEMMSNTDILTGVLNRNAMNNKIAELEANEGSNINKYGLIFVDVNSLKEVNDSNGHSEGDKMLKKVADKLVKIFKKDEIYRIGGDEFLIIKLYDSVQMFEEYINKLKAISDVPGEPTFAMGYYYDENLTDVRKALHIADGNMYKDKAEYYKNHPKQDRRQARNQD